MSIRKGTFAATVKLSTSIYREFCVGFVYNYTSLKKLSFISSKGLRSLNPKRTSSTVMIHDTYQIVGNLKQFFFCNLCFSRKVILSGSKSKKRILGDIIHCREVSEQRIAGETIRGCLWQHSQEYHEKKPLLEVHSLVELPELHIICIINSVYD